MTNLIQEKPQKWPKSLLWVLHLSYKASTESTGTLGEEEMDRMKCSMCPASKSFANKAHAEKNRWEVKEDGTHRCPEHRGLEFIDGSAETAARYGFRAAWVEGKTQYLHWVAASNDEVPVCEGGCDPQLPLVDHAVLRVCPLCARRAFTFNPNYWTELSEDFEMLLEVLA